MDTVRQTVVGKYEWAPSRSIYECRLVGGGRQAVSVQIDGARTQERHRHRQASRSRVERDTPIYYSVNCEGNRIDGLLVSSSPHTPHTRHTCRMEVGKSNLESARVYMHVVLVTESSN